MPVYIKELVVRAQVESSDSQPQQPTDTPVFERVDRQAMVEDCVEEVLRVLEKKQER